MQKDREYEMVVFSDDWFGLPFSCKHLLSYFLPEVPVVWVETIGLRSPGFNLYDIRRGIQKICGWLSSPGNGHLDIPENLRILDPMQVPYNHFRVIRKLNAIKMIKSVKKLRSRKSCKKVIMTTWPFLGDIIGKMDESLSIYYRVDDFSQFPGVKEHFIKRLEHDLMEKVDLIIASAENLTDIGFNHKDVRYLPHGVDFDHFSRAVNNGDQMLNDIVRPCIGFFGLLNSWVDLELVYMIAKDNPDWTFVLIGPSQIPDSELPVIENIKYIGPVPYDKLPLYAKEFDVAIIPFKLNKLTISVNPLKLMEYFSLGLPVVSTPLPEVAKFGEAVYLASDAKEFGNAISRALKNDTAEDRERRQRIAERNSWRNKSDELRGWIEAALFEA